MAVIPGAESIATILTKDDPIEFKRAIGDGRAIALFMTDWCGPCRMMIDLLRGDNVQSFMREHTIKGVYVDADAVPILARLYNLRSVPSTQVYTGQELKDSFVGILPESQFLNRLLLAYKRPVEKYIS